MNSRFYFATCQVGAEKAVKAEVLAQYPQLKFAFSRPGFITFKQDDDRKPMIHQKPGVFTRLWGTVLNQVKDRSAFNALIDSIPSKAIVHTFERDTFVPGDDPDGFVPNANINALLKTLPADSTARFRMNVEPELGEQIYDLMWVDDFHVFLGMHMHGFHFDPSPGNQPKISLPAKSPSRAYLKIAEAIHRYRPKIEKGMQVLEVGCSPGGATTAMLAMGMKVTGIDPKYMDEALYNDPNFKFIQKIAAAVTPEDLKNTNPDWIVMDMNIAPLEAIDELVNVLLCLRKNFGDQLKIKQGFLTLKLNDWKFAESIPLYLRRLEEAGFQQMIATQLNSNRQEFLVVAKSFKI
jgi:23S rRNA (cytidine2498-2'-O)-methyltransferase